MYVHKFSTAAEDSPKTTDYCFQIVFIAILTPVVLAAFLEWVLWLGAFLFCFLKVYQKADNWGIRFLAIVMMVFFIVMR